MKKSSTSHSPLSGFFKELSAQSTSKDYGKGQAIYRQGEAGNAMFRIEHGNVKLTVAAKQSNKSAVTILCAGDCFGESCLFGASPRRRSTATSIQQSTIGRIGKQAVLKRLHDEPDFAKLFMSHLLLRIARVEDDLTDQLVNSSERRLARLLWQLSDFGRRSERPHSEVNVDQTTLAQVVGTTRSRVSHFMNQFREKGLIEYNGSLRVHKTILAYLSRQDRGRNRAAPPSRLEIEQL